MKRALLVIDVQNDVVNPTFNRAEVVTAIAALVEQARANGRPVVWVQHNHPWLTVDSPEWQIVEELVPASDEVRIDKKYRSAFEDTGLAALERGFNVTLVGDSHTCTAENAAEVIAEQNANFGLYELPVLGEVARGCTTAHTQEANLC